MKSFENAVVLITGAAGGGIGTATARAFHREGATIVLNSNSKQGLNEVAAQFGGSGSPVDSFVADVSRWNEVDRMITYILSNYRTIDILVNNAAPAIPVKAIEEVSLKDWNLQLNVILGGVFNCCRKVVPVMKRQGGGKIVSISSSAAVRGSWGRDVAYAAAKAGIHGFTKRLALEVASFGINVNVVSPSQIDTPRARRGGRRSHESLKTYGRHFVPLGRPGSPEDVAELVVFLSSARSSYITGQVIPIDGGSSLAPKINLPSDWLETR